MNKINKHAAEAYRAGQNAAQNLLDVANNMTYEKEVIKGFAEGLMQGHRTLQQAALRAIFAAIIKYADHTYDPRNEAAIWACKQVRDLFGGYPPALPMI